MTRMETPPRSAKAIGILALGQLRVPAADNVRSTIPVAAYAAPIRVEIPKSPDMRSSDSVQLYLGNTPSGDPLDLSTVDLTDPAPLELTLGADNIPVAGDDLTIAIDYFVFDTDAEDGQFSELPVSVRFDRRAPGGTDGLPPLLFNPEQQQRGIVASDLVEDPNDPSKKVLQITVKSYYLAEEEDKIELWLGTSEAAGNYLTPTFTVTDPKLDLTVYIAEEDLRAIGDGPRYFRYRATDWAGNVSVLSATRRIPVHLSLPQLLAPLVPQNDDGLITYNDANTPPDRGVGVAIPPYAGAAAGDELIVIWGTQTLPPYRISSTEAGSDPIVSILVNYDIVAQVGNGPVNVSYQLRRTGIPDVPSPLTPVTVDLTTPGGPAPDPDPEKPEHGNIKAPLIRCGTSPDNTINPGDYGQDAQATSFRVGVDLNPIWLTGDEIQLHWGTISTPQIPAVPVTAANEGANIPIPVSFTNVIEAEGVGEIPVFFTITRQLAGGVPVTVQSPVQTVRVVSSGSLPGDGSPLVEGVFPDANARNIITRAVGLNGTKFRLMLDGVTNIELDKNPTISYNFVGVASGDATDPSAPPIEASRIKADDVPITQQMLDDQYLEVPLPYSLTYNICRNGAILDYSIANNLGRTNATQKFVRFAMNQGGGTCTLP